MPVNISKGSGKDDEVVERIIAGKYERIGWKIGKSQKQNRCPACFSAIKLASVKKSQGALKMNSTPSQRSMTRDERYLIFTKIDENYDRNKNSYNGSWNDEKIAKDFNVPRAWVSTIRDENFGPDTNEQVTMIITEANLLLGEFKSAAPIAEGIIKQLQELTKKADRIEEQLRDLRK
jgi:hypothetical protein